MLILVRHAPPFRRWHRRLGDRLTAAGHKVWFQAVGLACGRRMLAVERRLYRIDADWDAEETPPAAEVSTNELTIVLAGSLPARGMILQPDYAGATGEAALLAAAGAGAAPIIEVRGGPAKALRLLVRGRPAIEDPYVLSRALEDLLPRLVTLLVQAVTQWQAGGSEPPTMSGEDGAARPVSAAAFLVRGLWHKIKRRVGHAGGRPDHWRLALRREGDAAYAALNDDPSRFRADPFLFEELGSLWLFYEDYPYATRKGVIGRFALAAADLSPVVGERLGAGAPRVVLEEGFHLSYPLILRHGGTIYMLPEMSAVARVQLYRADPFPDRWVPDAILIAGCRLADATPVLHEGRWWLFAACDDDGGSSWDQLHLFHAPDLLGPWTPQAGNPVLIDAGAARPAGPMWHENGVLMRVAQDCRTGYGAGIAICRVDRLDEGGYRQSVVRRVGPPPGFDATGVHTLSRAAGWEALDLKVAHPR